MYALNLDKEELSECARNLLEYIKSDKFKNAVQDNIHRTRELGEMLKKEVKTHMNIWKSREFHYSKISENSKDVENDSLAILRNEKQVTIKIEKEPEILIVSKKKKKKKESSYY